MREHWSMCEAYDCPACGGPLFGRCDDEGESLDEPMQCVQAGCAAVVTCDMSTGVWSATSTDPERARLVWAAASDVAR